MRCVQSLTIVFAIVAMSIVASPARAAFHLWQVKEVFSNADGSVQFIEMFDSFGGEIFTANSTLTANSDGTIKTFKFPSNLTGSTPGSLLIATSGFGSLSGGVTPDFTFNQSALPISGSFFDPNATNLKFTFSGSGDSMSVTGASLPKDGIHSLTDAGAVGFPPGTPNIGSGVNSPTNLSGNSGSVNLSSPPPTGDYNDNGIVDAADYTVWRDTLGQAASPQGNGADGNANGTIDNADYSFWVNKFGTVLPGAGSGAAAPEPPTLPLLVVGLLLVALARYAR